jgi:hypothetical protein
MTPNGDAALNTRITAWVAQRGRAALVTAAGENRLDYLN